MFAREIRKRGEWDEVRTPESEPKVLRKKQCKIIGCANQGSAASDRA